MLGSDAFPRAALLAALHAVAVQVQCTSIQVHLEFYLWVVLLMPAPCMQAKLLR
jgi:hypothetical protein